MKLTPRAITLTLAIVSSTAVADPICLQQIPTTVAIDGALATSIPQWAYDNGAYQIRIEPLIEAPARYAVAGTGVNRAGTSAEVLGTFRKLADGNLTGFLASANLTPHGFYSVGQQMTGTVEGGTYENRNSNLQGLPDDYYQGYFYRFDCSGFGDFAGVP